MTTANPNASKQKQNYAVEQSGNEKDLRLDIRRKLLLISEIEEELNRKFGKFATFRIFPKFPCQ